MTTALGTDYRHMIRAGSATIIVSRQSSGTNSVNYVTSDHLGSSSAITNSSGGILVNSSFDAFGRRRGSNWIGNPSAGDWTAIASTTRRGFTEHTMLDNLNLTHMNGRVYDPMLGRFLSADPYITEPLSTQNYNRYSYVSNRPLSYTDSSGFAPITSGRHFGEDVWHYVSVEGWFTGWGVWNEITMQAAADRHDREHEGRAAPTPPAPTDSDAAWSGLGPHSKISSRDRDAIAKFLNSIDKSAQVADMSRGALAGGAMLRHASLLSQYPLNATNPHILNEPLVLRSRASILSTAKVLRVVEGTGQVFSGAAITLGATQMAVGHETGDLKMEANGFMNMFAGGASLFGGPPAVVVGVLQSTGAPEATGDAMTKAFEACNGNMECLQATGRGFGGF